MVKRFALLALVTACSVPDVNLDGKACPCADPYVCNVPTQTCVRTGDGDGGLDGAGDGSTVDAAVLPSCLGIPANVQPLFSDTFADLTRWIAQTGGWSAMGGEAVQASSLGLGLAYANNTPVMASGNYRVVVKARQTTAGLNGGNVGIAMKVQVGTTEHYRCHLEPNTRRIVIQYYSSTGPGAEFASKNLPSNLNALGTYTLEASANGGTMICCIRELGAAASSITSNMILSQRLGPPGMTTISMAGRFDDFVIYGP